MSSELLRHFQSNPEEQLLWRACSDPACEQALSGEHWHAPRAGHQYTLNDFFGGSQPNPVLSTKTGKQGCFIIKDGRVQCRDYVHNREIRRRERARNRKDFYEAKINELHKKASNKICN